MKWRSGRSRAQQGTSGRHIAELLAAAADVPLYDGKSLAALGADPMVATLNFDQLARRFRRLNLAGLALASSLGVQEAIAERNPLRSVPDFARTIINRAAHAPCVIYLAAAFAVARDCPNAIHVRIRAPFGWRVTNYQREHLPDRRQAERSVKVDDRLQHAWVRALCPSTRTTTPTTRPCSTQAEFQSTDSS
jgi:Cytidylate kinase-like family